MSARVVRRVTLVLSAVVVLLASREVRAMEEGRVTNPSAMVVGMGASGTGVSEPECGPQYISRYFCLSWEVCPAPEDLWAFCDAAVGGEVCPGMTYFIYDTECHDDHSHGDPGLWCWLTTGDPSWVGCHFVRVYD